VTFRPRAAALATLSTFAALAVALGQELPPPPRQGAWSPLPAELVSVLEPKAEAYRDRALNFTCTELIRSTQYEDEVAGDERIRTFDLLLVEAPDRPSGLRAVRTRPGDPDADPVDIDLPFPEAYAWTQLFQENVRSTLRFKVGDWHTTPWKLAIPISWISSAPLLEQDRITEWSGTAEIEFRTGNLLQIVARPSFQDERLRRALENYLTSFRVLGFSLAPPPEGVELTVDFGYDHEGFTYPTRVELREFRQVRRDVRATISRRVIEYRDYRFFGTAVEEDIPPLTYTPPDEE
jgi:hypothetical protein